MPNRIFREKKLILKLFETFLFENFALVFFLYQWKILSSKNFSLDTEFVKVHEKSN